MYSDWLGGEVEASHVNRRHWTRLTSFVIILFQGCVIDIFFTSTYSVGQQVRSMQITCLPSMASAVVGFLTAEAEGLTTKLATGASINGSMIKLLLMSEWVSASDQGLADEIDTHPSLVQAGRTVIFFKSFKSCVARPEDFFLPQCFALSCCRSLGRYGLMFRARYVLQLKARRKAGGVWRKIFALG